MKNRFDSLFESCSLAITKGMMLLGLILTVCALTLCLGGNLSGVSLREKNVLSNGVKSAEIDNDSEWKCLDEDERVLKAIKMGGYTKYLNHREILLYNETVSFMKSVQGKSDYEIALAAHNKVIDSITYDYDAAKEDNDLSYVSDSASAYGGLVDNNTVCAGYAKSFRILMESCGIETYYVTGKVPGGYYHAWNITKISGEYYGVDCTYDDYAADRLEYFLVSSEFMRASREWDEGKFPACTSKKYEYARYTELATQEDVFDYVVESISNGGTALVKTSFEIRCFHNICKALESDIDVSSSHEGDNIYYTITLNT